MIAPDDITASRFGRPMHDYSTTPHDLTPPVYDFNQMQILKERYLAKKPDGTLETPTEFLWRVAYSVARAEERYAGHYKDKRIKYAHTFYEMMRTHTFLPNTPCLVNAGRPLGALSACFVIDVPDSMDGIADALKTQMLIQKSGGGTGFSFSKLRAADTEVKSTGRGASGPVSFMKIFDAATDTIKQGGVRRGANMAVLSVDHPNIMEFIRCKKELDAENTAHYNRLADSKMFDDTQLARVKQEMLQTQFSNFNISVGLTEYFMQSVTTMLSGKRARFPLENSDGKIVDTVNVKVLWDAIVEGAWQNGEPGVLFLDHPEANPLPGLGPITATNPCGEQLLHGNDSCNLGSINVAKFFNSETRGLNMDELATTVRNAVRFLDNVIDENEYATDDIRQMTQGNRRIGLGIMGFADLLSLAGVDYGSAMAREIAEALMYAIMMTAEETTLELARERGAFPNQYLSIYATGPRRRNAALLSIAPTGTISMIAGCSYGCEPHFAIAYTKHVMKGADGRPKNLYYIVPEFERRALADGLLDEQLLERIAKNGGSTRGLDLPDNLTAGFAVTADVSMEQHVEMLCAFQEYTCNAVSKTINAPNSATREQVANAILQAWRGGAKGLTIYRDGSRTEQVVTLNHNTKGK